MGKKKTGGGAKKATKEDDDAALDAALEEAGAERGRAAELSAAGDDFVARGDWRCAVAEFTQAIAADPNNGVHYCKRSFAHMNSGRMADALADAKTAASLGGPTTDESASCHAQLGFVLCKDGKIQAALEMFDKGLKLSADNAGCRQGRDEARVMLERHGGQRPPLQAGPDDVDAQELRTLPSPEEVLGKGFEVVHLRVGAFEKPLRFLLCTTLQTECVITPNTCGMLGLQIRRSVDLEEVRFEGGHAIGTFTDCAVSSFLQAQMADKALKTVIHGMLGLPFLARYDLDLDRVRAEQRFKECGSAALAASGKSGARVGAVSLRGVSLPGGLLGVPVQVRAAKKSAPALGIVASGSMFTVINWKAAEELAIGSGPGDPAFRNATKVAGATKVGVAEMPLVSLKLSFCSSEGEIGCRAAGLTKEEFEESGKGRGWSLDFKSAGLKPCVEFGRVNAAIGDAIEFELLCDSTVGDFSAAAVMIGQDVLAQAPRLSLSGRDRHLWVDPPGRVADAVPV